MEHVDDRVRLAQVPLPDAEVHHSGCKVAADLLVVFHQSGPLLLGQLEEESYHTGQNVLEKAGWTYTACEKPADAPRRFKQRAVIGPAQEIVQQGGEPGVGLVIGVGLAAQEVQKLQNRNMSLCRSA